MKLVFLNNFLLLTLNPLLLIKEKSFSPFIPFYHLKRITNPSRHLHQFTLLKLLMSNTNAICILIYFTDLLFPQFSLTTFPALNFHPIPTLLQNAFFLGQGSSPSTAFVTNNNNNNNNNNSFKNNNNNK